MTWAGFQMFINKIESFDSGGAEQGATGAKRVTAL